VAEAVTLIAAGRAPRIPQDEALASYDPLCRDEHVAIEWSKPARRVYDLVRGGDPQPGAWAIHRGEKIRFYDCRLGPSEPAEAGRILGFREGAARIALRDGTLTVGRVRLGESPKKLSPADLAGEGRIAVGDQLEAGHVHG